MIKFNFPVNEFDETPVTIEKWYDRKTRNWIVQTKNNAGDQIGDAYYCYTRQEADNEINRLKATYNI